MKSGIFYYNMFRLAINTDNDKKQKPTRFLPGIYMSNVWDGTLTPRHGHFESMTTQLQFDIMINWMFLPRICSTLKANVLVYFFTSAFILHTIKFVPIKSHTRSHTDECICAYIKYKTCGYTCRFPSYVQVYVLIKEYV